MKDIAEYKVGVIAGDFVEGYLKDRIPHNSMVPFSDYDSLIKAPCKEGRFWCLQRIPGLTIQWFAH